MSIYYYCYSNFNTGQYNIYFIIF